MNDFILILQMKQGNDQAFDKFVRKYYADILSYCRYHCLNQTEAEDLTQETFLRFINNIQSYQHMGKAKNYLYVIAGNLCKNRAKKWKAESIETEVLERELVYYSICYFVFTIILVEFPLLRRCNWIIPRPIIAD